MDRHRARGRRARPSRRKPLLYTAVASAVLVGATATGAVYVKAQAHDGPGAVSSAAASASPSSSPTVTEEASVEPVAEPAVDRDALLAKAMKAVTVTAGAKASVAVLDLDSGASAAYGDAAFDTASIVKVNILAALLLQAQDADRHLTAQEKTYATAMIENSDNVSATALWRAIGRADGLDAANKRFGLTDTEGGDGELWGLTQTTASDQLTLLRQVFGDDSELGESSRSYLQGLMGEIAAGQRWGVSAAADGSQWALKNGWLARSTTGLWDINSIGRVSADGHAYLVAALSNGNSTQTKGIALVEAVSKAALSAFQDIAED
ncbi:MULTISPECIES: serine hydrolase [unclassified Streptomyces]|uniref:serine hydrolase n=1 Tax=unclassified Streptomyces TaxID=2593676 RepID=UPI00224F0040|nr:MULTISPECIES: serine hydrolase [unclassified Streptomyces]MCX4992145.1 class A beta-lactamase-related serine hydrolase [Streptomyces sp. NBC_00568]MCX5002619.1 class A beta-lactamase-related serine hydrolase [Streptomyces sp. NBC_00638]